jgi:glycosyltransferase involved in cell wall biosynthesis
LPQRARRPRDRKLTVLSVAHPFAAVGKESTGGAERILAMVEEAVVEAGHTSLVLARAGSSCRGRLIEVDLPARVFDRTVLDAVNRAYARAIDAVLDRTRVDVVHLHGVDFPSYLPRPGPGVLATLHMAASFYSADAFALDRPRTYLNCVSEFQRRGCPPSRAPLAVVPNGVVLDEFRWQEAKQGFVAAIGTVCAQTGFHVALDAAKAAGVELVLAGEIAPRPEHLRYFALEIAPRLDELRRFVGPVGRDERSDLLARASAVLLPSAVAETSPLVAMEALASGTPVIAAPVGALPDIVEHGRTGFLATGVEATAAAMARASRIDPAECRGSAEERFGADRMARAYLDLYERAAAPPS